MEIFSWEFFWWAMFYMTMGCCTAYFYGKVDPDAYSNLDSTPDEQWIATWWPIGLPLCFYYLAKHGWNKDPWPIRSHKRDAVKVEKVKDV